MADLLDLQGGRKEGGLPLCGSHGMSPRDFPSQALGFGYDIFCPVVEALSAAGFLTMAQGKPRWSTWTGQGGADVISTRGRVTRFRLTCRALESAEAHGIAVADWQRHWGRTEPSVPLVPAKAPRIVLHGKRVRQGAKKPPAPNLPVDMAHPAVRRFSEDLEALNDYLTRQSISGFAFAGLRRIWNNGDQPGFAWQWGGRYASLPGGDAYENMSAERRLERIRINGSAVAEVDIRACHLTLLYGLLSEPLDAERDPYEVEGLPRVVVKAWVGQALGASKVDFIRWSKEAKDKYSAAFPARHLSSDFKARDFGRLVLKVHPVLERLDEGELDSVSLMFHEAEVLSSAMLQLRLGDVAALPIHDGLIVGLEHARAARTAMAVAFAERLRTLTDSEPTALPAFKVDTAVAMHKNDD
ncbi:hypothetical protein SPMU_00990 [Sphingomonas mucosissima]|uniref:Uncharacterized protein n=2 Tax=Sphingomonas mucosissima TaxID=370959 RepID=A0A245ZPX1_9SPHN|nr:hypothetical protein SPMU_00990 [Sphingomonas mucosissima]